MTGKSASDPLAQLLAQGLLVPALDDAVADHDERHPSATQLLVLLKGGRTLLDVPLGLANAVGGKEIPRHLAIATPAGGIEHDLRLLG